MGEDKKISVLVVDDQADFRELLTFWLQSKGYAVITAEHGKRAIEIIKEKAPDIMFIDLRMPVMDGIEAIKNIRQFNTDLPIIIISSYVDDPRVKEAVSYGISGEFFKGADFKDGLSLLETILRTHKKLKRQ